MDNKILEKGFWGKNIEARAEGDTLILSGTGDMYKFSDSNKGKLGTIKNVIIEKGITSIGANAFLNNQLTLVAIPNSVKVIEESAFSENQLTSVIIPDSVTTIKSTAFLINRLTSVIIPNSVTTIGDFSFATNKLTSVIIPDSVISIGEGVFFKNKLTSLTIPDSIAEIGNWAFADNPLTSVSIPDSLTKLGDGIFGKNQPEVTRRKSKEVLDENELRKEVIKAMGLDSHEEIKSTLTKITFGNKLSQEQRIEKLENEIIQLRKKITQLENQKGLSKETMDDLLGDL